MPHKDSPKPQSFKIACLQLTSKHDFNANFANIEKMATTAATQGAKLILTPENSDMMGVVPAQRLEFAAHWESTQTKFSQLARQLNVWLSVGSIAAKTKTGTFNRSLLFDTKGTLKAHYDKIHLFDFVGTAEQHRESDTFSGGSESVIADIGYCKLGLTICYDLRFSYLYRFLAQNGCHIITVPAAFTRETGKAHWLTLLRARAIECGAFIVAPAQCGKHSAERKTWGHSVIISPWGEVLAQAKEEPEILMAELNLNLVEEARNKIPAWNQERNFTALIK